MSPLDGRRRGFTLVELMVVMVILSILSTLVGYAAVKLIESAKVAAVSTEISAMAAAAEAFKLKYGLYPPNFNDAAAVQRAWLKMFNGRTTETPPPGLSPSEALVFWLSGFGPDPTQPMASGKAGTADDRREKFFPFAQDRLQGTYPKQTYIPPHTDITKPYVYFDVSRKLASPPTIESLKPYTSDASGGTQYAEQGKFQIICAGVDNDYGTGGYYPSGTGMGVGDNDNMANFAKGKIEDAKP